MGKKTVVIKIEDLASASDGVGRLDGMVTFVPFTAPGDMVEAAEVSRKKKMMHARLVRLISPGADRREPTCPLFGECGGCRWQHVVEDAQRRAKAGFLARAVGLSGLEVVAATEPYGYRRLARLHLDGRRGILGFKRWRDDRVVDVERCPVLYPSLEGALSPLRRMARTCGATRVEVRIVAGNAGPSAHIRSSGALPQELYAAAAGLVDEGFAGVSLEIDGISTTLAGNARVEVEGGDGEILTSPASSFGQANGAVNRELCALVRRWVEELEAEVAVELYAGSGNLSVMAAPSVGRLVTGELDRAACDAAVLNLERRGYTNVSVESGDAVSVFERRGKDAQLVVLDPPRTGAAELCGQVAGGGAAHVLYVSCDPGTLRRDVEILARGGYKPLRAVGFDMFPQTAHMESAVLLSREG